MNFIVTKERFYQLLTCVALLWLVAIPEIDAQINTFPYSYGFENENTGPTGCNPSYTMVEPGWVNAGGDDMDWTNDFNNTGSGSTGPNQDHTPAPGTIYMYLETSCSAVRTANLESPTFDFTNAPAPQVSFWYHMYGASMGSLFFEASTNGGATWNTLWSQTGQVQTSSNDPWLQAVVNTASLGGNASVRFRFRGVSGNNFTGDMAIDDFLVENILPNNTGAFALVSPVLGSVAGNYPVDLTVRNFGSNAVDTVEIGWEINGTPQAPITYTGPSIPAFSNTNVNLSGGTNFPAGVTNMRFWTSMPNNVQDSDVGNDTLDAFFCTGLAGTYTVGTPASDFTTIADALTALYGCGVGGPVTMQVQAGSYNALTIDQPIPGISAVNRVTWDGSAQAATISANGGAAVTLDAIDYITIQNFTIVNTTTTQGWGILLTDAANYNELLNNRIQMAPTGAFNTSGIVSTADPSFVTSSGDNANYTLIEGNVITGADRGISLRGTSTTNYNTGNIIRNNTISNTDNYGIYTYFQDSVIIHGNVISDFPSTFHYGIYAFYSNNFEVTANDIRATDYGLYMSRSNSQTTPAVNGQGLVANNMIQTTDDFGMYMIFTRSTNVYHNTVATNNTAIVWSNYDNTVDVKNNIFVSYSQTEYAMETFTLGSFLDMDYNVFYTDPANPNLINDDGTLFTDLADWQNNGPNNTDQNSLEGLPLFVGPNDLHVDGAFLNDLGIATSVTVDIDGDVRPAAGAASVDIGADEFTPPSNDAGVADLISPTLPITGGFASVEIAVRNYGILPLGSFNIEWEIDGTPQPSVPYTGMPVAVNGSTNMILANINFPQNTTSLRFWTTMPNGVMDERLSNDTLEIRICPGLSGTYTVGHPSSDFATPASAVEALMTCGVSGPVTMQFVAGTYNGPWIFNEIPGANATNTVTFDGIKSSDAIITHDGTNEAATILMDGVDYLTIKNFTIENTGTATAFGVKLTNAANHNTIEENNIVMPVATGMLNVIGVLTSSSDVTIGTGADGNNANFTLVRNNQISGGTSGIIFEGGAPNFENMNNQIIGNDIRSVEDFGIYADEQDSLAVNGNVISALTDATSDAVQLNNIRNFTVLGNNINSRDYGIAIFGGFATGDEVRNGVIANNMVASTSAGEAMYIREADLLYVYHNTLSAGRAMWLDNHTNIDFRNNIMESGTGTCFYTFDPVSMSGMDHNLYFLSGANAQAVRFGTQTYNTLADWQTNGPAGYDANSVSGNPNFVNGLFIGGSLPVDTGDLTLSIPITVDINGDPRPLGSRPDIGADEHIVIANDAMVVGLVSPTGCGQANHDVIVSIANVGSSFLVSAPVTVNVTGDATATFTGTQPLLVAGTTVNLNLGSINTASGGTYNFEIILSVGSDTNPANDTLRTTVTIAPSNIDAITMTGDDIVCDGKIATVSATASYSPATIYWYDAPTAGNLIHIGNSFNTPVLNGPITYYAEIQGCNSARAATTVNVDLVGINVDLGADQTVCGGNAAEIIPTITLSNEVSIVWSDGSQSAFLEVFTAGTYTATVMNANGCEDIDTVQVNVSPSPVNSATVSNVTCGGNGDGAIDVTVSSGTAPYTFNWSNAAVTEDLTGLSGGFYNVSVTDANGCTTVSSYQVAEPTTLATNVDASSIACNTNDGTIDITVTGGSPAYTYNWSTGATTQDITNATAGVNTVTVTDANGCTNVISTTLAATTPIVIAVDSIMDEILALAGSIDISVTGGSGNYQYTWNTGATTQDLTSVNAGTYDVTVTDLNTGCQQVLTGLVVNYKLPDFVEKVGSVSEFTVYPNPTTGQVWMDLQLNNMETVQLEIINITGQVVTSFEATETNGQIYNVDMSSYPSGVYLARFLIGKDIMTARIIVE